MSEAKFNKAVAIINALPPKGPVSPTQEDQLTFYKYFKQAKVGDVNTDRPGMMDFTGKAKWDAWKSVEGTSKEKAWEEYVKAFITTFSKSDTAEAKAWIAEVEAL